VHRAEGINKKTPLNQTAEKPRSVTNCGTVDYINIIQLYDRMQSNT